MMEVLKCDKWEGKILIATVGLPYSGKSTSAKIISKERNAPIVCPDCIRIALHGKKFIPDSEQFVWAIAKNMVKALFLAGHNTVILDATNTTEDRRKEWISSKWETKWLVCNTKKEVCIERAKQFKDEDILPIIEKMAIEFQPVSEI